VGALWTREAKAGEAMSAAEKTKATLAREKNTLVYLFKKSRIAG
jgi:hypothetical protein